MFTERDISNPQASWVLTDVADNTTRGSIERIKEKMTKMSSLSNNLGKIKKDLEKALEEADRRCQAAETRATRNAYDADEATRSTRDAEERAIRNAWEAEERATKSAREAEEATRRAREAEERATRSAREAEEATRRAREAEERATRSVREAEEATRTASEAEERATRSAREAEEASRNARDAEDALQEVRLHLQQAEQRPHDSEERLAQEQALRARQTIQGSEPKDQQWLVSRREINLTKEKLGRGGWAKVQVAEFRGIKVAAKKLYKDLQSPFYHNAFIREMNMAARVRHPNLVQFIGACMDEEMIILLELMPTSLRKYLSDHAPTRPSTSFCTSVCMDVAKALNYLHLMQPDPIVHRDISCANVLLEPFPGDQWRAKVTDYGSVNLQSQLQTRNPGNPVYSAPESGDNSQQSPQMDIFSFGILMITMWTAEFPEVAERESLISSIQDRHCISLVRACLHTNRKNRPSAACIIAELLTWQH